jgi:hypothetical protein
MNARARPLMPDIVDLAEKFWEHERNRQEAEFSRRISAQRAARGGAQPKNKVSFEHRVRSKLEAARAGVEPKNQVSTSTDICRLRAAFYCRADFKGEMRDTRTATGGGAAK